MGLTLALRQCKISPKNIPNIYLKRVFRELILGVWGPHFGGLGASFWSHVGAMLGSKTALEPPKMPTKTRLGARPRPGPQNGSKMKPPDPQNELPEHPF